MESIGRALSVCKAESCTDEQQRLVDAPANCPVTFSMVAHPMSVGSKTELESIYV